MQDRVTGAITRAELAEGRLIGLERIVTDVIRALPDYSDHPLGVSAAVEAKVAELEATCARLTQEIAEREADRVPFAEAYARPIQASLAAMQHRALQAEKEAEEFKIELVERIAPVDVMVEHYRSRAEKAEADLVEKSGEMYSLRKRVQQVDGLQSDLEKFQGVEAALNSARVLLASTEAECDTLKIRAREMRAALLHDADAWCLTAGMAGEERARMLRHAAGEDLPNLMRGHLVVIKQYIEKQKYR
jgi:DNA repair exonuclease SbcCD ATPase subunit